MWPTQIVLFPIRPSLLQYLNLSLSAASLSLLSDVEECSEGLRAAQKVVGLIKPIVRVKLSGGKVLFLFVELLCKSVTTGSSSCSSSIASAICKDL